MQRHFIGLKNIPWNYILTYFGGKKSLFRIYQDIFLGRIGQEINTSVIEIGGELSYNHRRFFPKATSFKITNVNRDFEEYLDITNMTLENESQECYLCSSVLEHVFHFQKGIDEMARTLKKGGKLIITVPFAYPIHDEVDYWRFTLDSFREILKDFELNSFTNLGGKFSVFTVELQRPKGSKRLKHILFKILGTTCFVIGKILERQDNFPCGYAILATKK